jgi:hypothetical protein
MTRFCRRHLLLGIVGSSLGSLLPRSARAQRKVEVSAQTQQAIDRGLAWLAKRQTEEGAFGATGYPKNVAVCSLAGLAFLASGSTPGRGAYGEVIRKIVRYVLESRDERGFLCRLPYASHGPMYEHGFATLLLAEVYGMMPGEETHEVLRKAVRVIISSQNDDGGWRYQPDGREADISVTICQVMALRAARNAGVYVPSETIDRCIDYVKRCQNADGGFMYMLPGGPSRFPRSAAGVVALYSAGIYEGEELTRGLDYLEQNKPRPEDFGRDTHSMYGYYYSVQAMWQAGGERWEKWYPAIGELLVAKQQADGAWPDMICNEYGTAMACTVLQMPNNYLPIFQR